MCAGRGGFQMSIVDYDDNFSEASTDAAVVLCFNGLLLCPKGCHVCLQGWCWLFNLHSVMQVLHGEQLAVNHLFSLFSEPDEAGEN